MGATSVTGIFNNGAGAADAYGAGNKGSERMSLGVHRLIGPRVVGAGVVTLSGTTGTVVFPTLPGGHAKYSIQLTGGSTTVPHFSAFADTGFTVTGGSGDTVFWTIIKNGIWGSTENDGPSSQLANT
jgi:hypothetical protein